jgi:hypothetical protein
VETELRSPHHSSPPLKCSSRNLTGCAGWGGAGRPPESGDTIRAPAAGRRGRRTSTTGHVRLRDRVVVVWPTGRGRRHHPVATRAGGSPGRPPWDVRARCPPRPRPRRAPRPGSRVDDITAAARGEAPGGGGLSTRSNRRGACDKGGFEDHGGGDRRPAPRARRPPPHRPGPRGWRPRGRRPTRVPAAFDPSSPGASRSRQTSAPSRPDGRASRGTISPSPVQPSDFLSSSFNLQPSFYPQVKLTRY